MSVDLQPTRPKGAFKRGKRKTMASRKLSKRDRNRSCKWNRDALLFSDLYPYNNKQQITKTIDESGYTWDKQN